MSRRRRYDEYDEATTERCERALITLTLQENLKKSDFKQSEPSFQWTREVEGVSVKIEFLCETDQVEPGRIFKPKGESAGAKFAAFNIRGAQLVREDFVEIELEGERLDEGGRSRVSVRVANILTYTALKIFAFQDRHDNKDAYDLVFTLLNAEDGPEHAGVRARVSPIAGREQIAEALVLLEERFADVDQDGPSAYAAFLTRPGNEENAARLRQEAVATVRAFLRGLRG